MSIMIRSLHILKTEVKYYLVLMTSIKTRSIKIQEMTESVVLDRTVYIYGLVLGIHITGYVEEDSCD